MAIPSLARRSGFDRRGTGQQPGLLHQADDRFVPSDRDEVDTGHAAHLPELVHDLEPDADALVRLAIRRDTFHPVDDRDRKSTRLNSSHITSSYAVFCLKKKKKK